MKVQIDDSHDDTGFLRNVTSFHVLPVTTAVINYWCVDSFNHQMRHLWDHKGKKPHACLATATYKSVCLQILFNFTKWGTKLQQSGTQMHSCIGDRSMTHPILLLSYLRLATTLFLIFNLLVSCGSDLWLWNMIDLYCSVRKKRERVCYDVLTYMKAK